MQYYVKAFVFLILLIMYINHKGIIWIKNTIQTN